MKNLFLLALLTANIIATAQIGAKVQQPKVAGTWQNNQFGYQMTLQLNPDGKGEFDGEAIRYSANNGKLSLTVISQSQTTVYSYVLNANTLTVSGGDLEQPVAFTKAGTTSTVATTPATSAAAINTPGPAAITIAGPATVTTAAAAAPQATTQSTAAPTEQGLLGKWSGNNEEMEFRADGKCTYNGVPADYKTSPGHLVLNTQQGTFMMAYTVSGNLLKMTINGAQYTYTRVETPTRQGAGVKGSPAGGGAARIVPSELAGKWCKVSNAMGYSSNGCIVLHINGTYTYNTESSRSVSTEAITAGSASQYADQGTWWVEGDRIFYNSTTQGKGGSFQLEKRNHPKNVNDPMIVLDGDAFVTATPRQPWR